MRSYKSTQPDLVATIEACYRVEQTSEQWLRGVMETLSWLDQGLGIFGFTYTLTQTLELEADQPRLWPDANAVYSSVGRSSSSFQ